MYCRNCGQKLEEQAAFCPRCGTRRQIPPTPPPCGPGPGPGGPRPVVQRAPYNTLCIVGLVVSLISILLNCWGIVGIVGTVLSVIGLNQCTRRNENGRALAIGGIVIGVLSIVYAFVFLILLL